MERLVSSILETNLYFQNQAQKQVNIALTLRNWIIGYYIVEFEQNGKLIAEYGEGLIDNLVSKLKSKGLKGFSAIALRTYRTFYLVYPQIQQTVSVELKNVGFNGLKLTKPTIVSKKALINSEKQKYKIDITLLIERLSYSHFIELLKADDDLKRSFYENEAIKNNWSVRNLKRAIDSLLYERIGLSKNKEAVIRKYSKGEKLNPEEIFRNPYILEFLGLDEKPAYNETDLEQAIINHLQTFLLEMGRGFCFEARQKRITFDNKHYRIDLVFYHRMLKCHVLVDLKLGEFTHADAGQMNVYLNYYSDNEMAEDDNPPIGIILCAHKNESLVKYATMGLPRQVFVSKYLINLPSEKELTMIITEEQRKLNK